MVTGETVAAEELALVTVEAMVEMAVTLCLGVTGLTERMEERAV